MAIKVLVSGANGKMGSTSVGAISQSSDFELVAKTSREDNLAETIRESGAEVVVDFTTPEAVFENAKIIIANHAHPVIGTTGLTEQQISELTKQCQQQSLGGIIAPNFSLSAVLMMRYAEDAAKYFNDVEIIEMHHPQKKDAPSGTAIKTAAMIKKAYAARGKPHHNVPIHSVRLPGMVAHQAVIFGGTDETLTIRNDSIHRNCFMPGLLLACRKVTQLNHLIYGLDNLL